MAAPTLGREDRRAIQELNGAMLGSAPPAMRAGFAVLSRALPAAAERLATWLFCRPATTKASSSELTTLRSGERFRMKAAGCDLAAWSWGHGPAVVLHHGWNGSASHMARFVRPLLGAGFRVVAYDAPAHGASSGRVSAVPEMARVLRAVAVELGGIHGVVAHSMGGAVVMLAVRLGMRLESGVLLASPADLRGFLDIFGDHLGLSPRIREGIARRTAARYRMRWSEMNVESWADGETPPMLLVHDRADPAVPWAHANRIRRVWSGAELLTTTGLGHSGVRRDAAVIERAVAFLSA